MGFSIPAFTMRDKREVGVDFKIRGGQETERDMDLNAVKNSSSSYMGVKLIFCCRGGLACFVQIFCILFLEGLWLLLV